MNREKIKDVLVKVVYIAFLFAVPYCIVALCNSLFNLSEWGSVERIFFLIAFVINGLWLFFSKEAGIKYGILWFYLITLVIIIISSLLVCFVHFEFTISVADRIGIYAGNVIISLLTLGIMNDD